MKYILLVTSLVLIWSCGEKKVIQLPEIDHSKINEITDVSAAYIFYDETKPDSTELNRKNLISTTNWLVNVDKRLTLKQAIPQIILLQKKKRDAEFHKNEEAKNFYTCNDVSIKTLGFIEFTNTFYNQGTPESIDLEDHKEAIALNFNDDGGISILNPKKQPYIKETDTKNLLNDLKTLDTSNNLIYLNFHENLTFQDYVSYKSLLLKTNLKFLKLSNQEFIYN
ncbi:hypothetical protein [Snuella sedimenti]|uniref:Uncharacterized protein n=1 Tax=Snuella sedimenti TaxID=2798802 RepID=A0A8J7IZV1_9FLAO|nr:hypothetical protein [Snuella sedimenti]MBJ6369710.1 hypothetical protein [Snuella sedimenti]